MPPIQELGLIFDQVRALLAQGNVEEAAAPGRAAAVLGELDERKIAAPLAEMEQADDVREPLEHDEHSASSLMIPHVVAFRQSTAVQQAIECLRPNQPDKATSYDVFVTDATDRLIGVVSLRILIVVCTVLQRARSRKACSRHCTNMTVTPWSIR